MIGVATLAADAKERAKLARIRQQIEQTRTAINDVRDAPLTIDEATALALADIEEDAKGQTLALYSQPGTDRRVEISVNVVGPDGLPRPIQKRVKPFQQSPMAMLYHLLGREFFEKALRAHLAPHCANAGLPASDRLTRLRELRAKREELLDQEEFETCALEAKGFVLDRRMPKPEDDDDSRGAERAHVDRLLRVWDQVS